MSEASSFLGMANLMFCFIPKHLITVAFLTGLIHKGTKFKWKDVHEAPLKYLKSSLASDTVKQDFAFDHCRTGGIENLLDLGLERVAANYQQIPRVLSDFIWHCSNYLGNNFLGVCLSR